MSPPVHPHILVVEDDPATANIVSTVLTDVNPHVKVDVVRDGEDCLRVMREEHESIEPADIVLLDLNLLDVGGLSVLERRSAEKLMRGAPVIVVTGEEDSDLVVECYEKGANTYILKPHDLDGYLTLAHRILDYWADQAELPTQHLVKV